VDGFHGAAVEFAERWPAVSPSARIASEIMKEGTVPDWLQIILVMAAYIVLMRWVLPRLGIGT